MPYTHAEAAADKGGASYQIKTKRYERHPDRKVKIEFAKIEGVSRGSAENINYILEKEAFYIASTFMDSDLLERERTILDAIDKIKKQYIYAGYDVLYQDENILSIECWGESLQYANEDDDSIIMSPEDGRYLVFDVRTGKRLKLSDFVTIDRRIIDYRAEDYQEPDYYSDIFQTFYSFKDAFRVYEKKMHGDYNNMSVKEALKKLENGIIDWGIENGKELSLRWYYGAEESITIPYSCIKDFAKY